MMDGFAVIAADLGGGPTELEVVDTVRAGGASARRLQRGQAIRIMTGAPVPDGADAVVMIEQTTAPLEGNGDRIVINAESCRAGQNILTRSSVMARGETVMPAGAVVRAEDVGLLAEAGCASCHVICKPSLSVIATGDELIPFDQQPAASQIRNSNAPMLAAMAKPLCWQVVDLGIATDNREELHQLMQHGLSCDVLVLTGGVSAGAADLVPDVLADLGVEKIFHKVAIKPGKPIWFGKRNDETTGTTLVFGLPGNPVSSLVCFHVFVAPALRQLAGFDAATETVQAILTEDHVQRIGRTTYWPSRLQQSELGWQITPLNWKGSADLKTLATANCFAVFAGEQSEFHVGDRVAVLRI